MAVNHPWGRLHQESDSQRRRGEQPFPTKPKGRFARDDTSMGKKSFPKKKENNARKPRTSLARSGVTTCAKASLYSGGGTHPHVGKGKKPHTGRNPLAIKNTCLYTTSGEVEHSHHRVGRRFLGLGERSTTIACGKGGKLRKEETISGRGGWFHIMLGPHTRVEVLQRA